MIDGTKEGLAREIRTLKQSLLTSIENTVKILESTKERIEWELEDPAKATAVSPMGEFTDTHYINSRCGRLHALVSIYNAMH